MTVIEGQEVVLQGGVSGGDDSSVTYLWKQIAGPHVLLMGSGILTPRFTAPPVLADSVMVFELAATQGTTSSTDTVDITVINGLSPKAILTASPRQGPAPLEVTLAVKSATITPLPEGTYTWDFGDQTAAADGLTVNHVYQSGGMYTARLCLILPPPHSQEPICAEIVVTVETSPQTVLYVDADANGANDGTSWEDAYKTIQAGIDAAGDGDTIQVAAGEYNEYLTIGSTKSNITIVGDFGGYDFSGYEQDRTDRSKWNSIIDPGVVIPPNSGRWMSATDSTNWPSGDWGAGTPGLWRADVDHRVYTLTAEHREVVGMPSWYWDADLNSNASYPYWIQFCPEGHTLETCNCKFPDVLRMPEGRMIDVPSGGRIRFWDGIEALYAYQYTWSPPSATIYLRFRDAGKNPNNLHVSYGLVDGGVGEAEQGFLPGRPAVLIQGNNVRFKGFLIRGAAKGVCIAGSDAHHNTVECNYIQNGTHGVELVLGAHDNQIRANEVTWAMYGVNPEGDNADHWLFGAWSGSTEGVQPGDIDYAIAVKEHLYRHAYGKNFPVMYGGFGIMFRGDGENNSAEHNHLFQGTDAISSWRPVWPGNLVYAHSPADRANLGNYGQHKRILGNRISNMSSTGILLASGEIGCQVFENDVYDCNIGLRLHDPTVGPIYVYLNRFASSLETGKHVYRFYNAATGFTQEDIAAFVHPEVHLYHNSFAGGRTAISISSYSETFKVRNVWLLNNILDTAIPIGCRAGDADVTGPLRFEYNFLRAVPVAFSVGGLVGNLIDPNPMWPSVPSSGSFEFFNSVDGRVLNKTPLDLWTPAYASPSLPWSDLPPPSSGPWARDKMGAVPPDGYKSSGPMVE